MREGAPRVRGLGIGRREVAGARGREASTAAMTWRSIEKPDGERISTGHWKSLGLIHEPASLKHFLFLYFFFSLSRGFIKLVSMYAQSLYKGEVVEHGILYFSNSHSTSNT